MMTQGNRSLHVSGSKVTTNPDVHMDVNATNALQHLKQELATYQVENRKLTDQINCLVSLIKRSWSGDKHATIHLSNIVGLEPPQQFPVSDGNVARPNSQMYSVPRDTTRVVQNWERFALKLLEREYLEVQQEIREYQQRYIENRQAYMDAVLQDHHQNMARLPLHRKSDPSQGMEEVDSKFIRHNKALQRMGTNAGSHYRRAQSAGYRKRVPVHDVVEQMDVSLRELVGSTPSSDHFLVGQAQSEPRTLTPSYNTKRRPMSSVIPGHPPNTYNNPGRYTQNNLFHLDERDGVKRSRPVSASSLREGDIVRSRPRSGRTFTANNGEKPVEKPVFVTQTNERPLKYETTRPVSGKPKSAKQRKNSASGANRKLASGSKTSLQPQTDVISAHSAGVGGTTDGDREGNPACVNGHVDEASYSHATDDPHVQDTRGDLGQDSDGDDDFEMDAKPPVAVRVKSAFTRRPAFIDEFANEEKAMRDMEEDFKKTALSLQKRLGIRDSGMVTYD